MRFILALVAGITSIVVTAAGAIAGDQPDYWNHYKKGPIANVWLETSACPGFSTTRPLLFAGTAMGAYAHWNDPAPFGEEEGYTQIDVTATDGAHSYRIHQRYVYPRSYREYGQGYATTTALRDDGASMTGSSWLGIDPLLGAGGAVGVWWIGTPTCAPAKS